MSNGNQTALVQKVWNYAHVLRDQGISYGDYIEQITYLLFLKMDQERVELLGETSAVPPEWNWAHLAGKSGDALELQYRDRASRAEIGAKLELAVEGVKTLLRRGRAALRDCVERKLGR